MYTGRAPGVFVQDTEFLCAQASSPNILATFSVRKLFDDFGVGDASVWMMDLDAETRRYTTQSLNYFVSKAVAL